MAARNRPSAGAIDARPETAHATLARPGRPRVVEVLRRRRLQGRMSLRDVAEASGLWVSFLDANDIDGTARIVGFTSETV